MSLINWLKSADGIQWMLRNSFKRVGRWNNTLVRASQELPHAGAVGGHCKEAHVERRERENKQAVGGLRFAKRAVSRYVKVCQGLSP